MTLDPLSSGRICSTIQVPHGPLLHFIGPPQSSGKLPALFYFALSGKASLCTDPYCQPAHFAASDHIRVFSLTLPGHEKEEHFTSAIQYWAEEIEKGHNIIEQFALSVVRAIDYLIENQWIEESSIAAAGLSRGGFIAAHVAAIDPRIKFILGFAPVTKLTEAKEFAHLHHNPLANALNLKHAIHQLIGRPLRFYIGNHDTRVSTNECFAFISALAEASFQQHLRTSPVELVITPSQGHQGHGTLPHVFQEGISWLKNKLL